MLAGILFHLTGRSNPGSATARQGGVSMSLEIVRVEKAPLIERYVPPPIESMATKVVNTVKRRPALALAAVPLAPIGPAATLVAAGVAAAGIVIQEVVLHRRGAPPAGVEERDVERLYASDLVGRTDIRGSTLQNGTFYIRHPIHARRDTLIPARSFHKIILEEQLTEIVKHIRAQLAATSITIDATSEKTGAVVAGGSLHSTSFGAKLGLTKRTRHAHRFETRSPVRVAADESLVWIRHFPVLAATLDQARDGKYETVETTDLEFGLSLTVGTALGIDVRWLSSFSLSINVEFA